MAAGSYEVWSEGFAVTGEQQPAVLHGEVEAASFEAACAKLFTGEGRDGGHGWQPYFDAVRMTYWGCKLYDNEADARRSYG
jgi:hypothetical protein